MGCTHRHGDEIVIDGRYVRTGAKVILWTDPGGFNGYSPGHFGQRPPGQVIDQFVLHYDAAGSSKRCFEILQERKLSVHFLLDTDGTIYQTLDTNERAWHATKANDRSIGIEIANIGAYPVEGAPPAGAIVGNVQGQELWMHDFTPQQYDALIKLTSALCSAFPHIRCEYPRDASGRVVSHVLEENAFRRFQGVLGHFHVQANKQDPGPAFQWDYVIDAARRRMR